ncbi:hypothetical protein Q9966_014365 [Columba livia]|nr:hypothetical protein Q9966_014365 [Columba livia]
MFSVLGVPRPPLWKQRQLPASRSRPALETQDLPAQRARPQFMGLQYIQQEIGL